MLYREAGQFKTSYVDDQAIFPIMQDRWFVLVVLLIAYLVVPFVSSEYFFEVVLIPFLVFSMAAIGLNLLLGYAGQLSLGTGAFMGLGAFMSYKLLTAFPDLNLIVAFLLAGLATAAVGLLFGIPSLRIKGFYLAVSTLAAQFLLGWMFTKVEWFYNYNPSGTILTPPREMFGVLVTSPEASPAVKYIVALTMVAVFALAAKNLVRGRIGRLPAHAAEVLRWGAVFGHSVTVARLESLSSLELDELVDGGVADADGVAAALALRRLAAPEVALLVAGRL